MVGLIRNVQEVKPYRYGLYLLKNDEDPHIADALRHFDSTLYDETKKWTKRGATVYEAERIVYEVKNADRMKRPNFTRDEYYDWERIKEKVALKFSIDNKKVEPLSLEEAIEGMELNTSAGYSFKGMKKKDVLEQIKAKAEQRILDAKMGRAVEGTPSLIGTRGHLHLVWVEKRRITYNVPAEQVMIERMFSVPITEKLKANPDTSPMFFGKNLLLRLRRLLEIEHGFGSYTVQSDIETFDRDVPAWLIDDAFDIVESLLDFETFKGKRVQPAAQRRWKRVFAMVKEYFINTPVMLFDGTRFVIEGGVPSGSAFTQMIDSIINCLMMEFVALRTGHGVYDMKALGDDGKLDVAGRPDLLIWGELIKRWFGMTLSVRKSRIYGRGFRQRKFLGYNLMSGWLERDRLELFNLAVHPEKDVDTVEKSYTRLTAYMFLGGVNDVRFCQFFEFFQSCFHIHDVMPELDYDLRTKKMYAGFEMPLKTLRSYTVEDFRTGLFNYMIW